jgi:hypothetical protein
MRHGTLHTFTVHHSLQMGHHGILHEHSLSGRGRAPGLLTAQQVPRAVWDSRDCDSGIPGVTMSKSGTFSTI